MQQSQPSAPPPEYTRRDPAPVTPSALLGSSRTPSQTIPYNTQPKAQNETQTQSQSQSTREYYAPKPSTSTSTTTTIPSYARPPSPTPSTQTTTSTILPTYTETGSYKGFPSEAAYIAALTEWAEHKKYVQPSEEAQTLSGFFGYKTIEEYTEGVEQKDRMRARRKSSQGGGGERGGFVGFLKRMAKKDEGGGHGD
ncbi:hypothetical protein E4T44_07989 [Aureobasidium sp. EXF-8845]|nr:hypothetical protein E4T44_07989 [Aureobasidium sp. EXF-8845]KAI4857069.1 hypothetical protein E4T45_01447 [Aureobasidium sp. EXF-8846]